MSRTSIFVLGSLFHAWIVLSDISVQKQCSSLEVSGDKFINMNGKFFPDHSLQTMYKYDRFVNYTVYKHSHKNRIVYFIGQPFFWAIGKVEYVFTGQFFYTNRKPTIEGPWYTALDGSNKNIWRRIAKNNVSIICNEMPEKTEMSDSANTLHSKIMFLVVTVKIVIMGRLLRFFA